MAKPAPLLDREHESRLLAGAWRAATRGAPQLVLLWGRRRVGKTFLLSHFSMGKRAVFFGATQQAESVELGRLAEAVRRDLGDPVADLAGGSFSSWEAALRWFVAFSKKQPVALLIDEAPYLLGSTPALPSIVQVVWDHIPRGSKLMLVVTGSAIGTIEGMLAHDGALHGRPTLALRLDPLDPVAAREFLPRSSASSFLEAYAACGGYPLHLKAWDSKSTLEQNLLRLAASPGGLLLADAEGMLNEELAGSAGHARILAAIGRGRRRFGEIASEAGQRVEAPLETLTRSGFVRRALPVGAPKGAKPMYEIADAYLDFWFACLFAHRTEIEAGQGEAVLARTRPLWQRHMGSVFEEAARAHAARLVRSGKLPNDLVVGRWWAATGAQCEVDVLGLRGTKTALLGEARWQEHALDASDVRELAQKLGRVPDPVKDPLLVLWGRNGMTRAAGHAGAMGFSLAQMLGE